MPEADSAVAVAVTSAAAKDVDRSIPADAKVPKTERETHAENRAPDQ